MTEDLRTCRDRCLQLHGDGMSPELCYTGVGFIPLHTLRPHFYFKTHQIFLLFQSRQYHYLTFLLMRRVLMSPMRFVLAPLFILQVEAAATSAVQEYTSSTQHWFNAALTVVLYYKCIFSRGHKLCERAYRNQMSLSTPIKRFLFQSFSQMLHFFHRWFNRPKKITKPSHSTYKSKNVSANDSITWFTTPPSH